MKTYFDEYIDEIRSKSEERGMEKGMEIATIKILISLVKDQFISLKCAANCLKISVEKFVEFMNDEPFAF